jgi:hypothetical protein
MKAWTSLTDTSVVKTYRETSPRPGMENCNQPRNPHRNVQKMTLLKEFMTAENFTAAIRKLAEPICSRFDLPDVYQLGLVVPNAVAADEAMVRDWGLDPAFMLDGEVAQWIENGKELRVSARFGFTYHQGYELELIEPRQGADFYARDLNPDGEITSASGCKTWTCRPPASPARGCRCWRAGAAVPDR